MLLEKKRGNAKNSLKIGEEGQADKKILSNCTMEGKEVFFVPRATQQKQFSVTANASATEVERSTLAAKNNPEWKLRFNPCQDAFPGVEITKIGTKDDQENPEETEKDR